MRGLALACGLWVCEPSARAESRILDRVVAVVERRVVTLSELSFETRVTLVQQGGTAAASAPLDEPLLASALDDLIGRRLLLVEAERLGAFPLEESEVQKSVNDFRNRFATDLELQRFLARQDEDMQSLASVLGQKLRAAKVLDSKVRLRAQVTDAEVRRYYEAHQAELRQGFDSVRSALKEKLMRDRYTELAAAELRQARRSADVRVIAPFGQQGRAQ